MSYPNVPPPSRNLWACALFTLLAVGCLGLVVLSYKLYVKKKEFLANSARTMGTVTEFTTSTRRKSKSNRQITVYTPVFSYTDGAGATQRAKSTTGHDSSPEYKVGEQVAILYDAKRPAEVQPDTFSATWGNVLASGIAGVVLSLVCAWAARLGWQGKLGKQSS